MENIWYIMNLTNKCSFFTLKKASGKLMYVKTKVNSQ